MYFSKLSMTMNLLLKQIYHIILEDRLPCLQTPFFKPETPNKKIILVTFPGNFQKYIHSLKNKTLGCTVSQGEALCIT